MKKLAIDCMSISKTKTGVGVVLFNILKNLNVKNIEITLFFNRELTEDELKLLSKYKIKIIKVSNQILWEQIIFPYKIRNKYDYVWYPANTGSLFLKKIKKISTIHDVIFTKNKDEIPFSGILKKDLGRIYRKIIVKKIAKESERIYTVSEFSKLDILRTYKVKKDKILTVYNALDDKFKVEKIKNVEEKHGLLSFGSDEKRKNTELMIRIYNELIIMDNKWKEISLTLYGFKNYKESKIYNLIEKLNLKENIIIKEYVSDDELINLYLENKIFCFLSSYEGFGLPILEAMACGTPVVALNNSSIPEVSNDAAVLIDKINIKEMAKVINNLYFNEKKCNELVSKGLNNIRNFSWEKSAEKIENDLERLIK
ncbi:glycosyltransferase family 4 protein [Clostridium perfringens]|uniref:glycosyltransferase family 4 protein n=1 Tax=Clostridium perfringens TaxID=1502 RepID=UPI0013E3F40D|nr:glycosyltransferase family 1 protein [Clostridium perfringens]NGT93731.1 glycosyltransferase family 4 protein [Clostridium perfringens]